MTRLHWILHLYLTRIAPLLILGIGIGLNRSPELRQKEPGLALTIGFLCLLTAIILLQQRVVRVIVVSSQGIELLGHRWGIVPFSIHYNWQAEDRLEGIYRGGCSSHVAFRLLRGGRIFPLFRVIGGLSGDSKEAGKQMAILLEHLSGKECDLGYSKEGI
jgi:hypothetical protein